MNSFQKKGEEQIEELCHKTEDMLKEATKKSDDISEDTISLLFESSAVLRTVINALHENLFYKHDLTEILQKLKENLEVAKSTIDTGKIEKEATVTTSRVTKQSKGILVTLDNLDARMNITGEMIMIRNGLFRDLTRQDSSTNNFNFLKTIYEQVDTATNKLQQRIIDIRKVSIWSGKIGKNL